MPDFFNLIQRQESACNIRQWLGRSHADGRLFTAWLAALRLQASYLNQWCPRRGAGGGMAGESQIKGPVSIWEPARYTNSQALLQTS